MKRFGFVGVHKNGDTVLTNQPQLAIQLAIGSLPAIVVEHQERMSYLNEHKKFHQRVKKVFKWNFKLLQR